MVVVDRSPSESGGKDAFFTYIEDKVQQFAEKNPRKNFIIDYNVRLINLFGRIDGSDEEKEALIKELRTHSETMAKRRVCGVRIVQRALQDIPFVAALVDPYVRQGTLQSLNISSIIRPSSAT
jgi:hypothetical protein